MICVAQDARYKRKAELAENPLGSLPTQMHTWKETKALYRLLDEPDVTFAALMEPHLQQTREQATAAPVVVLVQDTTDIDLSHRRHLSVAWDKLATNVDGDFSCKQYWPCVPRGERCSGAWLRNLLCAFPLERREHRSQRRKRDERETDVWMRQVSAIGTPASGSVWVHVGDRGADMFPFFQACRSTQTHFLVRAAQNRRVEACEEEISSELPQARSWPSQASRPFEVPARHGSPARSTQLQLAFGQMALLPPRHEPRASKEPLTVWVIRVWEEQASAREEPLEWVRLPSVPTTTLEEAWERVDWYGYRWLVEDYHQCLKSGCRIEQRQGPPVDALIRRLGLVVSAGCALVAGAGGGARRPRAPGERAH